LNEAYRDFNSGWLSEIARSLASALSVLHTVDKEHASFRKALCINEKPWILQVSALTPAILGTLSAGNLHFLHIIQNDFPTSELCAMRDIWQIKTLIHGDIKSSNIMISTKMDSGISALKLVDWEFWSIGDPAWDIGGVLHDWFLHWVWATVQGRTDADVFIDNIKRAGAQFVQSYTGASIEERHSLFVRSIKMCAMRLLQSVFEQHQTAAELTKVGILSMQLSANLLSDPMAGSRDFLGR
jgi:thiamine kinase-like enzyme